MLLQISLAVAKQLDELALTPGSILERVDEYSLYCYYLGYEPIPNKKYRSPIRPDDEDPSFNIFYVTNNASDKEFMWKDQAAGVVGDIFRLVQLMSKTPISRRDAELKIASDFGLTDLKVKTLEKIVFHTAPKKTDISIHIHSRPFTKSEIEYWRNYNISLPILESYNVTAFDFYWLMKGQVVPFSTGEYSFAYRLADRYKLYWPKNKKEDKFRNNYSLEDIEGYAQLPCIKAGLLTITKSLKDVMFLNSIGLRAVSPRSENTLISPQGLRSLEKCADRIVTLFDNDGKHKASEYPYEALELPKEFGYKDPTDLMAGLGLEQSKSIIYNLLNI